jgi:hypothetical protein
MISRNDSLQQKARAPAWDDGHSSESVRIFFHHELKRYPPQNDDMVVVSVPSESEKREIRMLREELARLFSLGRLDLPRKT